MADDIFTAIHESDLPAIRQLIASDSQVARGRNPNGVSALMQAVYENKPEVVDNLRCAVGELDLYEAAALGDVARLHTLLEGDATQVNSRSSDGFTPLHLACFFRHLEAAQVLLAAGADSNAVASNHIAVIHSASASNDAGIVKLVLAAGADPNVQQQGGYTALQSAAMQDNVVMAKALLDSGADASIKNDEGRTASDMAAKAGAKDVAEFLRSHQQGATAG
jgi:uncharacterized protein